MRELETKSIIYSRVSVSILFKAITFHFKGGCTRTEDVQEIGVAKLWDERLDATEIFQIIYLRQLRQLRIANNLGRYVFSSLLWN